MSKLLNLLENMCPNGVDYYYLWEITAWDKKFNSVDKVKQKKVVNYKYYLANELQKMVRDNGTVKILTTNRSDIYTDIDLVEDTYSENEIIAIPWGGNPIVQYYNGKFITADNRIAIVLDREKVNTKFLYYCLESQIDLIGSFYRGSGIKHPDMSKVLDLKVPVPPIEVQSEIVRILDNFTLLTAELTAELTARKEQYQYYLTKLLTFDEKGVNLQDKTRQG